MLNGSFSFVCMSAVCLSVHTSVCLSVSEAEPSSLCLYLFKTIAQNLTTHTINFNDLLLTCHKTSQMNDRRTERQTEERTDGQTEQTDRQTYESTKQQLGARWQTKAELTEHWAGVQPSDVHLTYITMKQAVPTTASLSCLSLPFTLKTASQQCARVELDPVQKPRS